jgi:hypothetical protein
MQNSKGHAHVHSSLPAQQLAGHPLQIHTALQHGAVKLVDLQMSVQMQPALAHAEAMQMT